MSSTGQEQQHLGGSGFVGRLAENVLPGGDNGIYTQHDPITANPTCHFPDLFDGETDRHEPGVFTGKSGLLDLRPDHFKDETGLG